MRMLTWGLVGVLGCLSFQACQEMASPNSHSVSVARGAVDVHLSGANVYVYVDPNFAEESRTIVPGERMPNDGCRFNINITQQDPPAGRVAELDRSTCDYVLARGYLRAPVVDPPNRIVDTLRKADVTLM